MANSHAGNVVQESYLVPVQVSGPQETTLHRQLVVVVVRDTSFAQAPYLVLEHGRPGDERHRVSLGEVDYPANSRYFASRGFVVLIPTRIGYGVTGGPDLEYTGDCVDKHYGSGLLPALAETHQLLAFATALPYVDTSRGLIVGESFGGLIAIAAASMDMPGLVGAVNISGGDGGDSLSHPDIPCRPDQLQAALAEYGRKNQRPTLWMYSANDRLWGPAYPRQWFSAFTQAGGKGTFVALPDDKNNGHYIFNRNAPAWHPAFERFQAQLRLIAPPAR